MLKTSLTSSVGKLFILAALVLATGCGDNTIGPDNELEVANETDTFEWQVTALDKVTQTLSYTWAMTGTVANVNQSASPSSGNVSLRILDGDGDEVYSRSLATNGTFQTSAGTAGNWTIIVTLIDVSGAVNFRVEKP